MIRGTHDFRGIGDQIVDTVVGVPIVLDGVDWFNNRRLLGPIGDIPPAEADANYCQQQRELAMAA